jgi:hypothetical protein
VLAARVHCHPQNFIFAWSLRMSESAEDSKITRIPMKWLAQCLGPGQHSVHEAASIRKPTSNIQYVCVCRTRRSSTLCPWLNNTIAYLVVAQTSCAAVHGNCLPSVYHNGMVGVPSAPTSGSWRISELVLRRHCRYCMRAIVARICCWCKEQACSTVPPSASVHDVHRVSSDVI